MAFLPIAMAVVSAVGAVQQGQAAKSASEFNSAVSQRNAVISGQNAAQDAAAQAQQAAQRIGAARAAYAKGGVQLDEGSPLEVLAASARAAELDRQTILYQGRIQGQGYADQAGLDRFQGNAAATAGYIGGASSLLKGGYDAYTSSSQPNGKTTP